MKKINFIRTAISLVLILNCSESFSQFNERVSYVPPSPNSTPIMRMGNTPVDMYNGTPFISAEIGAMAARSYTIPISLSYQSSGIKVQDISSNVGLGWNLSCNAMITRMVRGRPDEDANGYSGSTMGAQIEGTLSPATMYSIIDNTKDAEPDLFYYSINGMTGKFVLNKDKNPVLLPDNGIRILNSPFKQELGIDGWILGDLIGNRFYFGTDGYSKESTATTIHGYGSNTTLPSFVSSWFLKTIVTANATETITYNYDTGSQITTTNYREMKKRRGQITSSFNRGLYFLGIPIIPSSFNSDFSYVDETQWSNKVVEVIDYPKYLTSVTSSGQSAYFYYDQNNARKDLVQGRVLNKIEIRNNLGLTVNTYNLYQSYFCSNSNPSVATPEEFRLKLDSICSVSSQNRILPLYRFTYNSTVLPARNSYITDHWGYYNYNGSSATIFPESPSDPSKNPNLQSTLGCMLQKITYPSGGYKDFFFELNQYENLQTNTNSPAGGLRISRIVDAPGSNMPPLISRYNYNDDSGKSTGILINQIPAYVQYIDHDQSLLPYLNPTWFDTPQLPTQSQYLLTQQHGCFVVPVPMKKILLGTVLSKLANFMGPGSQNNSTRYTPYIVQSNISLNNLFDLDGAIVGYSQVTIDNGTEGRTVNKFTDINDYPDYSGQMRVDQSFAVIKRLLPNSSPYTPATSYAFARGKLKESLVYDKNANLVKKIWNEYTFHSLADSVKGLKCAIGKITVYNGSNYQTYTNTYFDIGYYSYISKSLLLLRSHEEDFIPGAGSREIVTEYTYHSAFPTLVSKTEITNSDGSVLSANNKYVTDKALVSYSDQNHSNGANQLYSDGKFGILLECTQKNNSTVTGIKKVGFKSLSINSKQLTLPEVIYQGDGRGIWEALRFEGYDEYGHNLQSVIPGGSRTATVWDNASLYPIVECQNANSLDVYTQDFESVSGASSGNAFTGEKYLSGDYTVSFSPGGSGPFKLSYWYLSGGTWQFSGYIPYTGGSATLTLGDAIDHIQISPQESLIKSYTYNPVQGISSVSDSKGTVSRFTYDDFNRLSLVKDGKGNILKQYDYYIHTQPVPQVYVNAIKTGTYTKNNCSTGIGIPVVYEVPAGTYFSYTSEQDANNQAISDITANGQNYANQSEGCGVFARLEIDNYASSWWGNSDDNTTIEHGDVYIRFYTNSSCTTPMSLSSGTDVKVNVSTQSTDEFGSWLGGSSDTYTVTANTSSLYLGHITLSWIHMYYPTYLSSYYITESNIHTYSLGTIPGSKYIIQ